MSYSSNDPLRVVEVSSGGYASRVICKRSQFLTLYGPAQGAVTYELVMNSPTSVRDKVYRYISAFSTVIYSFYVFLGLQSL